MRMIESYEIALLVIVVMFGILIAYCAKIVEYLVSMREEHVADTKELQSLINDTEKMCLLTIGDMRKELDILNKMWGERCDRLSAEQTNIKDLVNESIHGIKKTEYLIRAMENDNLTKTKLEEPKKVEDNATVSYEWVFRNPEEKIKPEELKTLINGAYYLVIGYQWIDGHKVFTSENAIWNGYSFMGNSGGERFCEVLGYVRIPDAHDVFDQVLERYHLMV